MKAGQRAMGKGRMARVGELGRFGAMAIVLIRHVVAPAASGQSCGAVEGASRAEGGRSVMGRG